MIGETIVGVLAVAGVWLIKNIPQKDANVRKALEQEGWTYYGEDSKYCDYCQELTSHLQVSQNFGASDQKPTRVDICVECYPLKE